MQVNNVVSFKGGNEIKAASAVAESCISITEKHKATKELQKKLVEMMPLPIRLLKKMEYFVGEVPNIIINAVGTGLVAPIFIKYNCLSKTDDDTRSYSALRQPISAALAVITQAGVVIPVNAFISKMSNEGRYKDTNFNKSGYQDVDHIAKGLRRKEQPGFNKARIIELAEQKQLEQLESLVKQLEETGTIEVKSNGKIITLDKKAVEELIDKTSRSMIEHIDENIKRYDGEKRAAQIQRGEFYRTNGKKAQETFKEIAGEATKAKNNKQLKKWLSAKVKAMKKAKEPSELINIVNEIVQYPDIKTIIGKIKKVSQKCSVFSKCETKDAVRTIVQDEISESIKALETKRKILETIQAETKEAKSNIKEIFKKGKGLGKTNFAYEVIQKHLGDINESVKGKKQLFGLGVSLAILPVTCSILNYVYPRFVEAFFPQLANVKKTIRTNMDEYIKFHIDTQKQHSKEVK